MFLDLNIKIPREDKKFNLLSSLLKKLGEYDVLYKNKLFIICKDCSVKYHIVVIATLTCYSFASKINLKGFKIAKLSSVNIFWEQFAAVLKMCSSEL